MKEATQKEGSIAELPLLSLLTSLVVVDAREAEHASEFCRTNVWSRIVCIAVFIPTNLQKIGIPLFTLFGYISYVIWFEVQIRSVMWRHFTPTWCDSLRYVLKVWEPYRDSWRALSSSAHRHSTPTPSSCQVFFYHSSVERKKTSTEVPPWDHIRHFRQRSSMYRLQHEATTTTWSHPTLLTTEVSAL